MTHRDRWGAFAMASVMLQYIAQTIKWLSKTVQLTQYGNLLSTISILDTILQHYQIYYNQYNAVC